jgi:ABC-type antimicrobial peptide transport system permease subunit
MNNGFTPPRFFQRLFRWCCRPDLHDHIEGDLLELYQERVITKGRRKADLRFIMDVVLLLRPGIIRSFKLHPYRYGMFKNHLTTGKRRLLRNKGYAFINIGGLAIGLTVAMFIGLWMYDELSFNKYHKNYDSIAQAWSGSTDPQTGKTDGHYSIQYPVAAALRNNFPHYFKHVLLAYWIGDYTISTPDRKFSRKGEFIEAGAAEMLSLKMIYGSYKCLDNPNSIILSRSSAEAIFGNNNPMNKTLRIDNRMDVQVTGVYEDIPANNRFSEVQFFAPWALWESANQWIQKKHNDWDNRPFNIYVQLQPDVTPEAANALVKDLYYKNMPPGLLSTMRSYKPFVQLVPMRTWHLYAEFKDGKPAEGRIMFVWLFGIIGVFVLLLACINFINLSTARSEKRAKEVGVRKAIGSGRGQLVMQFLTESFLVVLLAFIVSLVMVLLLKNWFNELADKDIALPFGMPVFWLMALGFILFTGFMAGVYPAFYLSSFRPVKVLKGVMLRGRSATLPRKVLVVVQFTVSVVLIIGTLVVYQQVQFAQDRPIGYDRNNLITIPVDDPGYEGKQELIKSELLRTGVVSAVGASSTPLTGLNNVTGGYDWKGRDQSFIAEFGNCKITHGFGKAVGWELIAGRDFSPDLASDSTEAVIINEAAAKYMNMKNPVGEKLLDVNEFGTPVRTWTIIGLVKDIVMGSPYEPARQTIFLIGEDQPNLLQVKINPTVSTRTALAKIKAVFESLSPSALFEYKFVDQEYARKFSQEQRIGKLSGVFALLAILISCLGLSGLASYVAEQRTREIGIRKVMGASVSRLWQMLSKEFVILVVISCLLAIPVSYYLMISWLQQYEYRTGVPWWTFLLTTLVAVFITILTVSYQSIKIATLNPVKSLRSE